MGADEFGQHELEWKELIRTPLGGDIEDAMLKAAADFERENPPPAELARPTWQEVKRAKPEEGPIIEFVDELEPFTEMQYVKMRTEEGHLVEGYVPLTLPEEGLKVLVGGSPALLYVHPGDGLIHMEEVEVHEADDEEQAQLLEMSKIEAKIIGYNPLAQRQLYGVSLSDEFVDWLLQAWEHVGHDCTAKEAAETYLSRFMEQMIGALHLGDKKKDML